MCAPTNQGSPGANRKPLGGFFGAVIKDFVQAKNPTINPVKRTIDNWDANSPKPLAQVNPAGAEAAGKAASAVSSTPFQAKPAKISGSFLGTGTTPFNNPESGYKIVG